MKRSRVRPKRPGPPRRGRVVDLDYMAWLHRQPCLISGRHGVTVHHVREFGSQKNDRRTLPLIPLYHLIQADPHQKESIEALGKKQWQEKHDVDIEAAIMRYNSQYDQETQKPQASAPGV